MAKFITRVQLQEAQQTDFEKLDIEMEGEGCQWRGCESRE